MRRNGPDTNGAVDEGTGYRQSMRRTAVPRANWAPGAKKTSHLKLKTRNKEPANITGGTRIRNTEKDIGLYVGRQTAVFPRRYGNRDGKRKRRK